MPKNCDRREFLTELLKFPSATLLLGVVGPVKLLAADGDGYDPTEHYYAMGIHVDKCIGCGKCAWACKTVNDVPEEPFYFRTWVERYIVYTDGEVEVDSPEGGIHGSPPELLSGVDLSQFEIPRIDFDTHGGTFACWDCHYQHSPEAR